MEDAKALSERLDVVIRTLNQRLSRNVVRHGFLRRAEWSRRGGVSGRVKRKKRVRTRV
jgi:hypothetical protein